MCCTCVDIPLGLSTYQLDWQDCGGEGLCSQDVLNKFQLLLYTAPLTSSFGATCSNDSQRAML